MQEQVRQTQEQMDARLRPWVGNIDGISPDVWDNKQGVSVYLKNWGDIPTSPCDMKGIITANKITKDDINALASKEGGIIMPKSRYEWRIYNEQQVPIPRTEAEQFFVGFWAECGYGIYKKDINRKDIGKKGTFGFVAEYDPSSDSVTYPEYWGT